MLRFNEKQEQQEITPDIFQYILCYGSTYRQSGIRIENEISIHPMLRFNSCGLLGMYTKGYNFNTSYVTVQRTYFDSIQFT